VPLRSESRRRRLTLAAAAGTFLLTVAISLVAPAHAAAQQPDKQEIDRALAKVKADPNLATSRKVGMLKWKNPGQPASSRPGWFKWIVGLFRWLDQTSRLLMWGIAGLLIGLLVVSLLRILRARNSYVAPGPELFVAPSHVSNLDIRPESLPADVGSAARALWDRNEGRAALALLYRGLLSRLVHVHRLSIRASSTEGDCVWLAEAHLPRETASYTLRLVRVWQRGVYGREDIQTAAVHDLCDGFSATLDGSPQAVTGGTAP
jgi:hypothetical protein